MAWISYSVHTCVAMRTHSTAAPASSDEIVSQLTHKETQEIHTREQLHTPGIFGLLAFDL